MFNMNTWKNKVLGIGQECWEAGRAVSKGGCMQHATNSL